MPFEANITTSFVKINVSIVIPVYNEEKILEKSIRNFVRYFSRNNRVGKFELVIVENGSTDNTLEILKKVIKSESAVKIIAVGFKSLGRAITLGIKKARYPYIYFNAIDNPFEFEDFEKFLDRISSQDLIFASKNHPQSVYKSKISRIIASKILSVLNRIFFAIPVSDTQGTFMGRRAKLVSILPYCTAKGAFFSIQLAIYSIKNNFRVSEVSVRFISKGKKSSFSLLKDGFSLLGDMVIERIKRNK